MEELIVFRVAQQLREHDYTEFSKELKAVKTVRIIYIIFSLAVFCSSIGIIAIREYFEGILFLVISVAAVILLIKYPEIMGANLFKNYTKLHLADPIPNEIVLCENHIFENSNNSSATLEYSQFEKIVETNEHFFLMITKSSGLILRKDSFIEGDINQFRGFIASKSHIY